MHTLHNGVVSRFDEALSRGFKMYFYSSQSTWCWFEILTDTFLQFTTADRICGCITASSNMIGQTNMRRKKVTQSPRFDLVLTIVLSSSIRYILDFIFQMFYYRCYIPDVIFYLWYMFYSRYSLCSILDVYYVMFILDIIGVPM